MWENGAPTPPPVPKAVQGDTTRRKKPGSADHMLWAQIVICLLAAGLTAAARFGSLPFYADLRRAFAYAMQPDQTLLLQGERALQKFTEEASAAIADAANILRAQTATGETAARTAHGKAQAAEDDEASVPANARAESYMPSFTLTFPLADGTYGETSGYGFRDAPLHTGTTEFHLGEDLAAAQGTPVLAAADGVVRYAGSHTSYGNLVRILHEHGDETLYAHMQYLFVHSGQRVTAGQVIGTVGQTGDATGPHLHFELLHKGLRYDPTQALQNAA